MTLKGVALLNFVPQILYVRHSRKQELRQRGAFQRSNSPAKFSEKRSVGSHVRLNKPIAQ
jgi:hypothetical protein